MPPVIALLTDFGTQDHYVGAMKGAILTVCPEAQLVDIVHEVAPHDVEAAAFMLAAAHVAFPPGTVFLAVVDPDVGSSRRALAMEARGWRFVAPDNGLLTLLLADDAAARLHEITNAGLYRHEVSATFHGRDVFGPVAGHLARGLPLEEVGPPVHDPVRLSLPPVRRHDGTEWESEVVHVDRFGNLTTNLTRRDLEDILAVLDADRAGVVVVVEGAELPLARTYSDVSEGEACALVGSAGRLEIAVNGGSAARLLGAARGAAIRLRAASDPQP